MAKDELILKEYHDKCMKIYEDRFKFMAEHYDALIEKNIKLEDKVVELEQTIEDLKHVNNPA